MMKRIYISTLLLAGISLILSACDKDLGLSTKYDNSQSSIVPDPNENYNPNNTVDWGDFTMTESIIINQSGIDMQGFWPDGKISVIKDEATRKFISFWGEKYSYRTEGEEPYPETQISQVTEENRVFGVGFEEQEGFNDGGSWFIGVHPLSDGRLAGFFHAESHWDEGIAYKSIGVAYSSDKGRTWTKGEKILNVDYPKPTEPRWSGLGDGCVIYNKERGQFICYYSAYIPGEDFKITMAVSEAVDGASGSWKKWDGNDFTVEGYNTTTQLGGPDSKIEGLGSRAGANPSVIWNRHLQKWVMVYAGWDNVIYMSTSDDGLDWESPMAITDANAETATYPNLIGDNGDTEGGEIVKLYYGRNQNPEGVRELAYRVITYK